MPTRLRERARGLVALGEAALLIANAEDPGVTRDEVEPALMSLVHGLRTRD